MAEGTNQHPLEPRVSNLEELQTFGDRRADLLSEQMAILERRLHEAIERIRRLEEGLGKVDDELSRIPKPATPGQDAPSGSPDAW